MHHGKMASSLSLLHRIWKKKSFALSALHRRHELPKLLDLTGMRTRYVRKEPAATTSLSQEPVALMLEKGRAWAAYRTLVEGNRHCNACPQNQSLMPLQHAQICWIRIQSEGCSDKCSHFSLQLRATYGERLARPNQPYGSTGQRSQPRIDSPFEA